MSRVEGPVHLPPCGVCGRPRVRVRRGDGYRLLVCLGCDGGPLVEEALAILSTEQRQALGL